MLSYKINLLESYCKMLVGMILKLSRISDPTMCSMKKIFDVKSDGTSPYIFLKVIMNFLTLFLLISFISISSCKNIGKSRATNFEIWQATGKKRNCRCGFGGYCPWNNYDDPKENCFCKIVSGSVYETCDYCSAPRSCGLINYCKRNPCANGGSCSQTFGSFYCRCKNNYHGQTCRKKFGPKEKRKFTNVRR